MLIVIDIQEQYLPDLLANPKSQSTLDNIAKRIKLAILSNEPILNLTYFEDGCTLPEVLDVLDGYRNVHFLYKDGFDGSESVCWFLERNPDLDDSDIELCGMFKDVCVLETWKGLRKAGKKVRPVSNSLTLATVTNWRKINEYPRGYCEE